MAKLLKHGYTNFFGDGKTPLPIEILRYDNNKYAKVRLPSGEETEVKSGYIYADQALTRRIPEINWFILGGGKRRDFKPREQKKSYDVRVGDQRLAYQSKQEALYATARQAKELNSDLEIWLCERTKYSWGSGGIIITCTSRGDAYQQNNFRRTRALKYLKGYGKIIGRRPRVKGVTY